MKSKNDVKKIIHKEKELVFSDKSRYSKHMFLCAMICFIFKNFRYYQYRLMKSYRYFNYYSKGKGYYIKKFFWGRAYGKNSLKLHCQINCDNIGPGFYFEHPNIVINKNAIIGENFYCVGNNCIGSNQSGAPIIGDNVYLGYGAMIIEHVKIANNVTIGAGAVITKDILMENAVVVGNNLLIKR